MNPITIKGTLYSIFYQAQQFFSKDGWVYKTALAGWLAISGIHLYLYAVVGFAIVDVITGVWASRKKGEEISSKKLRKGLIDKIVLYLIIMLVVFTLDVVLQSVINHTVFYMAFIMTLLITVYETTSIIENMIVIYPDMSFLNRFKGILNKVVDKQIENVENKLGGVDENKEEIKPGNPDVEPSGE